MKKIIIGLLVFVAVAGIFIHQSLALTVAQQTSGRILLQVQQKGEAWYVRPSDSKRYYLKDGTAAYQLMRLMGLGITNANLAKIPKANTPSEITTATSVCATNSIARQLRGQILLQVQQHGEAWYVDPVKCKAIYLKNGTVAYDVMRSLGLGISNNDLQKITSGSLVSSPASVPPVANNTVSVTPPPDPVVIKAGSFRDSQTYIFPDKTFTFNDWSVRITPDLAFKNSQIRLILTTSNFTKRGNIVSLKGVLVQLNQNPATPGFGKTEDIVFRNDGTAGDDLANDQYFTAQISSNDWYDIVSLTGIIATLRDGTTENVTGLSGITFVIFDGDPDNMVVFEADHGVGVMSTSDKNAAQAFAQGVDLCYQGLVNQIGDFTFRNGKAYYEMKQGNGYLETGGFINTVTASNAFFSAVNPNNNEWNSCSPISSHELTHSVFIDVRKPVWVEEGIAEFTSREIAKTSSYCESGGWRDGANGVLHPYISLSQQTWRSDSDHYATATCAVKYIQDTYGRQAIKNIYNALQSHESFAVSSYCGSGFDFYQDIIFSNTDSSMKNILQTRFGIPASELLCQSNQSRF
jgi:hypothetical protein